MFTLEVEFLLGRYFASQFDDQTQPEWPPNPARLFSALAASYFEAALNRDELLALQWLERLGPPSIKCGVAGQPSKVQAFVPTNYPGDLLPTLRGRQPRNFPVQSPSEAVVYFMWPDATPDEETLSSLRKITERTGSVGRATSLVRISIGTASPEPTHVPDLKGSLFLQVPYEGRLKELQFFFSQNRRPTPGSMVKYRVVDPRAPQPVPAGEFETITFLERVVGPGLPIDSTLTVTDAFRAALLSQAGRGSAEIPEALHGHSQATHCALIAPPFVQHRHADGHLMGVGIAFPRTISGSDRRLVLKALAGVVEDGLCIPDVGCWQLDPVDSMGSPETLRASTWNDPSSVWTTVTPILLDRFPKKNGPSVEQIIAASCKRAGYPQPLQVAHSPYPYLNGTQPVPAYRLHRKNDDRPRWGVHAKITFESKVRGPVILGAGRFFGLGLMRPSPEQRNQ